MGKKGRAIRSETPDPRVARVATSEYPLELQVQRYIELYSQILNQSK